MFIKGEIKVKKISLLLVALMFMGDTAAAHTFDEVEKTCPICSHTFSCIMDMSGYQSGMRLDLKPLGPTPAPWSIPVCPKCSFVIYDEEIPAEELAQCKEIIKAESYKIHSDRASYYLLGLLYEGLGKEPLDIGHIFLKASWQEESDKVNLKEDRERSLKQFEIYLGSSPGADEEEGSRQTEQLLKGELLRCLGRFDEAKTCLKTLLEIKEFQGTFLENVVEYEIKLCEQKDSASHDIKEVKQVQENIQRASGEVEQ